MNKIRSTKIAQRTQSFSSFPTSPAGEIVIKVIPAGGDSSAKGKLIPAGRLVGEGLCGSLCLLRDLCVTLRQSIQNDIQLEVPIWHLKFANRYLG